MANHPGGPQDGAPSGDVLVLRGEIDVASVPAMREELRSFATASGKTLVVDLSAVTFIDSTGLGALVSALHERQDSGGDLQLVVGNPSVRRLFTVTGLDTVFTIHESPMLLEEDPRLSPDDAVDPVRSDDEAVVELIIPADVSFIGMARLVAAAVASRAGFSVERIDDLRLALDELLLPVQQMDPSYRVRLELCGRDGFLRINSEWDAAGATTKPMKRPAIEADLSTILLNALVDQHGKFVQNGVEVAWLEMHGVAPQN
jgi:anti-sigma B factor antagonist